MNGSLSNEESIISNESSRNGRYNRLSSAHSSSSSSSTEYCSSKRKFVMNGSTSDKESIISTETIESSTNGSNDGRISPALSQCSTQSKVSSESGVSLRSTSSTCSVTQFTVQSKILQDSVRTTRSARTETTSTNSKEIQIEYEFVVSGKRRKSELLWSFTESMFYKRNSAGSNGKYYICYDAPSCKARLILRKDGTCVKTSGEHNHCTREILYKQFEAENKIKMLCLKDRSTKSTKEIYEEVLLDCQDLHENAEKFKAFTSRRIATIASKLR